MSSTPENNLDEVLKAYAQQRRDEAGAKQEMPAATRRRLQAEVARTFPQRSEPAPWLRLLSGFWPRLAFGCGLIAVLAVSALVSLKTEKALRHKIELAQKSDGEKPVSIPAAPQVAEREPPRVGMGATPLTVTVPAKDALLSDELSLSRGLAAPAADGLPKTAVPDLAGAPAAPVSTPTEPEKAPTLRDRTAPLLSQSLPEIEREAITPAAAAGPGRPSQATAADLSSKSRLGEAGDKNGQVADAKKTEGSASTVARGLELGLRKESAVPGAPAEGTSRSFGREATLSLQGTAAPAQTSTPSATVPITLAEQTPALQPELLSRSTNARADAISDNTQTYYFQNLAAPSPAANDAGGSRARFSQKEALSRRRNSNSPPLPKVLTSFELRRQGPNVLVVDADGSVYTGEVQTPPIVESANAAALGKREDQAKAISATPAANFGQFSNQALAASNASEAPAAENYSFRAVGTNRTLNQKVVFTGNYLNFNTVNASGGGFGGGGSPASQSNAAGRKAPAPGNEPGSLQNNAVRLQVRGGAPQQLPGVQNLQNERIEGRASVGGTTELPIEAMRVVR